MRRQADAAVPWARAPQFETDTQAFEVCAGLRWTHGETSWLMVLEEDAGKP
jgi:hypothetical protein